MTHEILEADGGLSLEVDGTQQALIRTRGGNLDLVWCVRGPQDLDRARQVIIGLLDLLVHYDGLTHSKPAERKKGGSKFS